MIETLLTGLYQAVISFVEYIFDAIFGGWNYGVLFSWLPQDIQNAVETIFIVLFGWAIFKTIRALIP